MELICKCLGGSRAYHLNTPESDTDLRGVFLNLELDRIIGLSKYEHQEKMDGEDTKYKEVRAYFKLLSEANTEAIEMLFTEEFLEEPHPLFRAVQKQRDQFLDTKQLFRGLRSYLQGERQRTFGLTTGALGGKRKDAIEKYGYSYKNLVQGLRLALSGAHFFKTNVFPVNLEYHAPSTRDYLFHIKTHPESLSKERAAAHLDDAEKQLIEAFEARDQSKDLKFNKDLANHFILRFYYAKLKRFYVQHWAETGTRWYQEEMDGYS